MVQLCGMKGCFVLARLLVWPSSWMERAGSQIGSSPIRVGANPGSGATLAGCEAGDLARAMALALARRVWTDPLKPPVNLHSKLEQIGRNSSPGLLLLMHQPGCYPHSIRPKASDEFRDHRLHVIHEGIDTQIAKPNPDVSFEVRGVRIDRSVPTSLL